MSAMNKEIALEELSTQSRVHEVKENGVSEERELDMGGADIARIERVYQYVHGPRPLRAKH